ncbi:hypothetical protein EDD18DRAFT_1111484 [Armillaria luteobubalina]|uniref:Uncharacterized protein n=1 Tax=Armillaria luteobubalina TaxID=153913 RepID=A0AA39PJT0_9AGAR|nr:hypothetical protein EDD18DRAFT_1111484 [Armillaria luteobubalina]
MSKGSRGQYDSLHWVESIVCIRYLSLFPGSINVILRQRHATCAGIVFLSDRFVGVAFVLRVPQGLARIARRNCSQQSQLLRDGRSVRGLWTGLKCLIFPTADRMVWGSDISILLETLALCTNMWQRILDDQHKPTTQHHRQATPTFFSTSTKASQELASALRNFRFDEEEAELRSERLLWLSLTEEHLQPALYQISTRALMKAPCNFHPMRRDELEEGHRVERKAYSVVISSMGQCDRCPRLGI